MPSLHDHRFIDFPLRNHITLERILHLLRRQLTVFLVWKDLGSEIIIVAPTVSQTSSFGVFKFFTVKNLDLLDPLSCKPMGLAKHQKRVRNVSITSVFYIRQLSQLAKSRSDLGCASLQKRK